MCHCGGHVVKWTKWWMGCGSAIFVAHTLPVHKVSWDLPWSRCWWVGRAQPGVHGTLALASLSSGLWAVAPMWAGFTLMLGFPGMTNIHMATFSYSLCYWGFYRQVSQDASQTSPWHYHVFPASQVFSCHSLMHSQYWGSLYSLLVCTAMCAIAHHTQPCALGHGLLYLALDQGKLMMLLWTVNIQKLQ